MTQQEHEEYVRSKWKHVEVHRELIAQGVNAGFKWWILIVGVGRMNSCITEVAAWQAAYDFTVAREEEIRQLEREAVVMESKIHWCTVPGAQPTQPSWVVFEIRTLCAMCRTLARLQRDLAELTKGMGIMSFTSVITEES